MICLLSSNTCEIFKDCFKLTQISRAGCSCYLRVLHVLLDSCTPNSLFHPCPYPGSPHIPTQNANTHNESLCAVPCFQDFPKPLWSFPSLPLLWLFKEEDVLSKEDIKSSLWYHNTFSKRHKITYNDENSSHLCPQINLTGILHPVHVFSPIYLYFTKYVFMAEIYFTRVHYSVGFFWKTTWNTNIVLSQ